MDYLPIFIDVRSSSSLVVGAGDVARRKIETLLKANATVVVVAQQASAAVKEMAAKGRITLKQREFLPSDIHSATLVIAAQAAQRR